LKISKDKERNLNMAEEMNEKQTNKVAGIDLKDKKKVVVIVGILLVVVAVGALIYSGGISFSPATPEGSPGTEGEQGAETGGITLQDAMRQGAQEQDASACDILVDDSEKQRCVDYVTLTIALNKKDVLVCDQITDERQAENCRDNVYFVRAINEKDATLCDEIASETIIANCLEKVSELQGE